MKKWIKRSGALCMALLMGFSVPTSILKADADIIIEEAVGAVTGLKSQEPCGPGVNKVSEVQNIEDDGAQTDDLIQAEDGAQTEDAVQIDGKAQTDGRVQIDCTVKTDGSERSDGMEQAGVTVQTTEEQNAEDESAETEPGLTGVQEGLSAPSEAKILEAEVGDTKIVLTAPEGAFDVPSEQVSMTAEFLSEKQRNLANELLSENLAGDNQVFLGYVLYDIKLWYQGEEIQPRVPVEVSFFNTGLGRERNLDGELEQFIIRLDEKKKFVENVAGTIEDDGTLTLNADHFTLYGAAETMALRAGEASNVIPSHGEANQWQIVSGGYLGNTTDKKEPSSGSDVKVQKNVIPTDTENEFYIYISMDKKMSWKEILDASTVNLTTQGSWGRDELGNVVNATSIGGKKGSISLNGTGRRYTARITIVKNGMVLYVYQQTMFGTTPNASNCTGYLTGLPGLPGKAVIVAESTNLHEDGNGSGQMLEFTIDLDKVHMDYSVGDISLNNVTDPMGNNILYENEEYADGKIEADTGSAVNWQIAENELVEGSTIVTGSGSASQITGFYQNIAQAVYKIRLDVEGPSFVSGNIYVTNGDTILYYNRTDGGVAMPDSDARLSFTVPEVKGTLYNLQFTKKDSETGQPIEGTEFQLKGIYSLSEKEYSEKAVSDNNGTVRFKDYPWGTYNLSELSAPEGYDITVEPKDYTLCYTTDPNDLEKENSGGNYKLKPSVIGSAGIITNRPWGTAEIEVQKVVENPEKMIRKYGNDVKFPMELSRSDEKSELVGNPELSFALVHEETTRFNLKVSYSGAVLNITEALDKISVDGNNISEYFTFRSAVIETLQDNSDAAGSASAEEKGTGSDIRIYPGNKIKVIITNTYVPKEGQFRLKKVVDGGNLQEKQDFEIKASHEGYTTSVMLADKEISGFIVFEDTQMVSVEEVVPYEYQLDSIQVWDETEKKYLNDRVESDGRVRVEPDDDLIIEVHNTFSHQGYFKGRADKDNHFTAKSVQR